MSCDRFRQSDAGSESLPDRNHAIDEPNRHSFAGIDLSPGEHQVERPPPTDDQRESLGSSVYQGHAKPTLEAAKHRRFRGDPKVAPESHLQSPGDAITLDGGDRGLAHVGAGKPEVAIGMVDQVEDLEIAAGGD